MNGELDLTGRRAVITGAASGIGRATAVRWSELGASVVVADIDEKGGSEVADLLPGATFRRLDVADAEAWTELVTAVGPFDLAFLNAGVATDADPDLLADADPLPIADLTDDRYRRIMGANVDGVVFGARAVLPGMAECGSGDIVVTASIAGLVPMAPDPIYGLTKHAVIGFVRSLAAALARHPNAPDICVSAICPGFTDTNILNEAARTTISQVGLDIMPTSRVVEAISLSLWEREQGAQWVVWPGLPPHQYEWNPIADLANGWSGTLE